MRPKGILKDTRIRFFLSCLLIMILFLSLLQFKAPEPQDPNSTPTIPRGMRVIHEKYSVFSGFYQSELVEKLAEAAEVTPLKSYEVDKCCCDVWYKYYYQYNYSIQLELDIDGRLGETWVGSPIVMFGGIKDNVNITNDSQKAMDMVLNIWKRFISSLGYQMDETDYIIDVESLNYSWMVTIKQTFNDNNSLENTGVRANVIKETSRISRMEIYTWSARKIEKPIEVSLEDAKEIIEYKFDECEINISKLIFNNYTLRAGEVCYNFISETLVWDESDTEEIKIVHISTTYYDENGMVNESSYETEHWKEYFFYVNIESGELEYDVHHWSSDPNEGAILPISPSK